MQPRILITETTQGYELLDSGNGEKLERFGDVILARPDPEAIWDKQLGKSAWEKAEGAFVRVGEKGLPAGKQGNWKGKLPESWQVLFANFNFEIRPTSFKHVGLFPEQLSNWKWMQEVIKAASAESSGEAKKVLNLFAYTGGASIACARAGANVTHVDGSKSAIAWAKKNAELSHMETIRFLLDDCLEFLKKEERRGNTYDGIILDPPSFGHGPNNEIWKIEEQFLELVRAIENVLSENPLFICASGYASGYSPIAYENAFRSIKKIENMKSEFGELAIKESGEEGRLLPAGIYWRAAK